MSQARFQEYRKGTNEIDKCDLLNSVMYNKEYNQQRSEATCVLKETILLPNVWNIKGLKKFLSAT